jgi:hypothetical protein
MRAETAHLPDDRIRLPVSRRFTELVGVPPRVYRRDSAGATAGMPSCVAKQVIRTVRNREARSPSRP